MGINKLNINDSISGIAKSLFGAREESMKNIRQVSEKLTASKPNTDTFTPSDTKEA